MEKTVETIELTKTSYSLPSPWGHVALLVLLAIFLIPFWRIWRRTGHSGFWSILMIVPFANLVSLWVLAFKKWPALAAGRTGLR